MPGMPEDSRVTAFRSYFPEFTDATAYTQAVILFWYGLAETRLENAQARWADLYTPGLMLLTAHYVVIAVKNEKVAAAGGVPGENQGVKSSKAVGGVSASYDTNVGSEKDAGQYNLTTYGRQFYSLMRIAGMGGVQL